MTHLIDPTTNLVYKINTPNILQIVSLLERTITSDDCDVEKNLHILLSLSKEIVHNEMANQTPLQLEQNVNTDSE